MTIGGTDVIIIKPFLHFGIYFEKFGNFRICKIFVLKMFDRKFLPLILLVSGTINVLLIK